MHKNVEREVILVSSPETPTTAETRKRKNRRGNTRLRPSVHNQSKPICKSHVSKPHKVSCTCKKFWQTEKTITLYNKVENMCYKAGIPGFFAYHFDRTAIPHSNFLKAERYSSAAIKPGYLNRKPWNVRTGNRSVKSQYM